MVRCPCHSRCQAPIRSKGTRGHFSGLLGQGYRSSAAVVLVLCGTVHYRRVSVSRVHRTIGMENFIHSNCYSNVCSNVWSVWFVFLPFKCLLVFKLCFFLCHVIAFNEWCCLVRFNFILMYCSSCLTFFPLSALFFKCSSKYCLCCLNCST